MTLGNIRRTLIYHLDRPAKSAPGSAIRTVHVAGGVDIGPPTVQGRVNHEPGRVNGQVGAADPVAVLVYVDHVRHLEHAKVHTIGVDPERVWLNGVCSLINTKRTQGSHQDGVERTPETDVPAAAVREAQLRKDAEGGGHLLQLPPAGGFFRLRDGNLMEALHLAGAVARVQRRCARSLGRGRSGARGRCCCAG